MDAIWHESPKNPFFRVTNSHVLAPYQITGHDTAGVTDGGDRDVQTKWSLGMKKRETVNGGAWGKKFDAIINTDVCDRYNNAEITVVAKLFLQQGNPDGGAKNGTANDANGNAKNIIRWTSSSWRAWTSRFVQVNMRTGHGKFWLINNLQWNKFKDRGVEYYPNIWCRLKIEMTKTAAAAHHTITVYRVTKSNKNFRSDFSTMDSYDNWRQKKGTDSAGKTLKQRPSVHELFHILGVRHVDHGKAHCPLANGGNAASCYGVADADMHSLMGSGMKMQPQFADPWRRAAVKLTARGTVGSGNDWQAAMQRHYPRTFEEWADGEDVIRRRRRK